MEYHGPKKATVNTQERQVYYTAYVIEFNPSTANWFLWLHVMRKHSHFFVVTGKVEREEREGVKDWSF